MGTSETRASETRAKVRALVRKHGALGAARLLRMDREVILGIAADANVRDASLVVAELRLTELDHGGGSDAA